MKNEKGFATIFGLCLILIIALIVKGIQESEMNHAYETIDFQTEFDLQNAADSGIYKAVKLVRDDPSILKPARSYNRKKAQVKIIEPEKIFPDKEIMVTVFGERVSMEHYKQTYPSYGEVFDKSAEEVYILLSKAEVQSKHMDGKIYRRAFAYVSSNADGTPQIHFMEVLSKKD